VLVSNGKITGVGKGLAAPAGARTVDAAGRHITPGIIDEHSHIAINGGVNECSHSVTAECRIGDVVNSEDVNIYRHLAGGVVAIQQLHGSCNSIGGQSSLVKMRWGAEPEQLKIAGADGFIKCALGENVKQSNWGEDNTSRYPQTRMGVEQVFKETFARALAYRDAQKAYAALSPADKKVKTAPRRDLQLETVLEILEKRRFISCHSYVASEILMLMRVADSLGFRVNTFTHILEGYKVAEQMKKHGAGASTFSDWWYYKMEVNDAIPYNAALMHNAGITVAINSDDAEMARRLNQEAAKTIRYGGLSEEDALKTITLNPAKLLHLDAHMGSLKVGKDADIVLWDKHPFAPGAKPLQTLVDGIVLFDIAADAAARERIATEKNRLIKANLDAKGKGPTQPPTPGRPTRMYHCEDTDGSDESWGG
jgi:imidazolonepropionase-like amidohydrolase